MAACGSIRPVGWSRRLLAARVTPADEKKTHRPRRATTLVSKCMRTVRVCRRNCRESGERFEGMVHRRWTAAPCFAHPTSGGRGLTARRLRRPGAHVGGQGRVAPRAVCDRKDITRRRRHLNRQKPRRSLGMKIHRHEMEDAPVLLDTALEGRAAFVGPANVIR